jgi:hypothetical protein
VRAGIEAAVVGRTGGGMNSKTGFIREGREGARRKGCFFTGEARFSLLVFSWRFFASFADKKP